MNQETRNGIAESPPEQSASVDGTLPRAEALPTVEASPVDRQTALVAALMRAGTLTLSDWERAGLAAPFPAAVVRQRKLKTRTENYIPHIQISRRLCDVLGIGQWCLIRLREWFDEPTQTVYGSYALVVRGVWVGDTVAGWPYQPANRAMDYADAMESCRGVALRRIAAKSLRCGDQVWAGDGPEPSPEPEPAAKPPTKPTIPPLTPERLAGLRQIGTAKALLGTVALSSWWAQLLPAERVALASSKNDWKVQAQAVDAAREQAEAQGETMSA